MLEGKVPLSQIAHIEERQQRVEAAAVATALAGFEQIRRSNQIDLYRRNAVYIDSAIKIDPSPDSRPLVANVEISDSLAVILNQATERHKAVEAAFEKAKKYLERELGGLLSYDAARARSAANFLLLCRKGATGGFLDASNREKASFLVNEVEDMIKRKNPGHPNFIRAVERARGYLYRLYCPTRWGEYPPPLALLNID